MDSRSLAKKLIEDKKLRPESLAVKAGYSYSTVTNWLAGKQMPRHTEKVLAQAVSELMSESDGRKTATG